MVDSTKFGLSKDIEVKFFTPEEASKVGASSGYNAVYKIGKDRVRYELLKAGKSSEDVKPTPEVKQEPVKTPKTPKQQKAVEIAASIIAPVKEDQPKEIVTEVQKVEPVTTPVEEK